MLTPWTLYWLTRLEPTHKLLGALLVIGCVAAVGIGPIVWGAWTDSVRTDDEPFVHATMRRFYRYLATTMCILLPLYLLIPSGTEAAAIIVLPHIVNNENVQALGSDLPKLAREWLDELRPASKKAEKPVQ